MKFSKLLRGSLLPLVVILIAALGYFVYYNTYFGLDLTRRVQSRAEEVVQSTYFMCQVTDRLLQKRSITLLADIEDALDMFGRPSLGPGRKNWEARSPEGGRTRSLSLAPLRLYHQSGETRDLDALVNLVVRRTGGEVSILQMLNERGDLVNVYCTLDDVRDSRQVTELIPLQMPGGQPDVFMDPLLRGETVLRPEHSHGRLYFSIYFPLREGRRTVAVLVVRVIDPNLDRLRENLLQLQLGRTGYVFALKATGAQRGHYVISSGGLRDGEDIWRATDAAGRPIIRSLISQALNLNPQQKRISVPIAYERYPWRNPGETHARHKTSAITYFEPWDWAIGAGYYEDEL
ncbi:Cache 3/Cache 2 fusion domain-containing protein [Geoalkalibacter halelectricus]|uniref:Cache 3/Cache 2 fusion domain-containing protein n=1 Tax=Geoalkalibacter halelectricus TaxID=2847045 RepID=A0ABY5ZRC2_9BACT|nr:Cache 3/Cache 2 fusion domain-containing protein [Geoalkalibacter halelectricus]MDO3379976.1 Cache 3/Cache 2 fusion domain-containing protein [Geoalkalibacter halelectricus]UWZ80497.1 Cache 3/Cache 2 fusion domain-containing protein [Geoalkalibacter halelectricus]